MTLASTTNKITTQGNGLTTQFSFNFEIPLQTYLQVIYTDADGVDTEIEADDYIVTGIGDPEGGYVTYPLVGSPIASGTYLTIIREVPLEQPVAIGNQGNFYPEVVEAALDYLMMAIQQINETFERALVAPITDPAAPLPLPTAVERALQLLGFDADGNPIAAEPSSALVSTAMQPVVAAATLALARTAMGLGTMATEGIGAGLEDDGSGNARVNFDPEEVATNQAITSASHLKQFIATGALTFTNAKASTLWSGFGYWVFAGSSKVTIALDAADSFRGQSSGASISIPANSVAWITTNGTATWYISWMDYTLPFVKVTGTGGFSKLAISNNAITPNSQIDVAATQVTVINSSGFPLRLESLSGTVDALTVGAVNGLDTGVFSANTWYYIYAIAGVSLTGTVSSGLLLSASATAPTMPSGYTYTKLIGAWRSDGSVQFYRGQQNGRRFQYVVGTNPAIARLMAQGPAGTVSTTAPSWSAAAVANFVPSAAGLAVAISLAFANKYKGNGPHNVIGAPNGSYAGLEASSGNAPPIWITNNNADARQADFLLESGNVFWAASGTGGALMCLGYTLNI